MAERFYGFNPQIVPPVPFPTSQQQLSYPSYISQGSSVYPSSNSPYPSNTFGHSPTPSYDHLTYRWIDSSIAYGSVPPSAVQGGMDVDGHAIYVGRAFHNGDLIPAKVIPGKNAAYIAHNGEEHLVEEYQVLCRQDFEWVPCHGGHIPPGAVQGGHTSGGEVLYVGRAYHEGSHTVGKVHPSHGVCYIPFGGQEIAYPQYEILVVR